MQRDRTVESGGHHRHLDSTAAAGLVWLPERVGKHAAAHAAVHLLNTLQQCQLGAHGIDNVQGGGVPVALAQLREAVQHEARCAFR